MFVPSPLPFPGRGLRFARDSFCARPDTYGFRSLSHLVVSRCRKTALSTTPIPSRPNNVGDVPGCGTSRAKTQAKRWRCPRMWDISDENTGKTLEMSLNVGHLVQKHPQNVGDVPECGTSRAKTPVKRWRCPRMWDISCKNTGKTLEMSPNVGHLVQKHLQNVGDVPECGTSRAKTRVNRWRCP
jgi:hypothetical protein